MCWKIIIRCYAVVIVFACFYVASSHASEKHVGFGGKLIGEFIYEQVYSADVRLKAKLSKSNLKKLSQDIAKRVPAKCQNIFIIYYLPHQQVGHGAWANAVSLNRRSIQITIFGTTVDEDKKDFHPDRLKTGVNKRLVGIWRDKVLGFLITIKRDDAQFYIEMKFKDGSGMHGKLKSSRYAISVRLDMPNNEEYFILTDEGHLTAYDSWGKVDDFYCVKFIKGSTK